MKRIASIVFALATFAGGPVAADAPAPAVPVRLDAQGDALFRRMLALNADLKSYTAAVHLDVALKTFPYISPSLDGNVYYKKPDKEAVIFDTVPALASQFKKVYPKVDPPSKWLSLYDVANLGDAGGVTTYRLVPKKNGRVDHLDVRVDDATATIVAYAWTYKDGGSVSFDQTYRAVNGDYLVEKQIGRVNLPSYKADVTSNFSNYKLNVAIADAVFSAE
jgi:outer membrane lipoprotein-sorting protein